MYLTVNFPQYKARTFPWLTHKNLWLQNWAHNLQLSTTNFTMLFSKTQTQQKSYQSWYVLRISHYITCSFLLYKYRLGRTFNSFSSHTVSPYNTRGSVWISVFFFIFKQWRHFAAIVFAWHIEYWNFSSTLSWGLCW